VVEKIQPLKITKLGVITRDANMMSAVKKQVPYCEPHGARRRPTSNQIVGSILIYSRARNEKAGVAGFWWFYIRSAMVTE
jgi:hypothetical protein